jgi:hypothetical protein
MMISRYSRWLALGAACVILGIAMIAAEEAKNPEPPSAQPKPSSLGMVKESAIEACGPKGERAYLDRLVCPDGSAVKYARTGSVGFRNEPKSKQDEKAVQAQMLGAEPIKAGQKDFHMLDGYEVECGAVKTVLYLDMYHCPEPKNQGAPPGFSLTSAGKLK